MKATRIALPLIAATMLAACSSYAIQPAVPAKVVKGALVGDKGMALQLSTRMRPAAARASATAPAPPIQQT